MGRLPDGIDRLDDHTLRFRLTRAEAPFLADLAMSSAKIPSAEQAGVRLAVGTPEMIDREPVGTGPLRFEDDRKGTALRFSGFPEHRGRRPPLDQLAFSVTPDPSVRQPAINTGYLALDASRPPFDGALGSSAGRRTTAIPMTSSASCSADAAARRVTGASTHRHRARAAPAGLPTSGAA